MQVVVDDLLVNYLFFDNSNSEKYIVVLPGWMHSAESWRSVGASLSEDYKVIVLDFPGFGKTPKPQDDYDIYAYADFVESFLAKISVKKCILLGHSFGGRVASILAAKTDVSEKLILVDSAGIEVPGLFCEIKNAFVKILNPLAKILPAKIYNKVIRMIASEDYKNAGDMRVIFKRIIRQDLMSLLSRIKVPTLIIWGDRDKQLDVSLAKVYRREISNSLVRIVWGAGHNPHLDKPEKFLEILNQWL